MRKLSMFISILPKIKSWIYADGKFNLERALLLAFMFVVLLVAVQYFPVKDIWLALEMLDEVSDIIGYSD